MVFCFFWLQALLSKYLDAACSLLFELLLVGDEVSPGIKQAKNNLGLGAIFWSCS